jgi:3-oxoacyl-[acyl-carrier-protein] synthase-3
MTPDYLIPSTAALIQSELKLPGAAAFDMQAACTGFIYGLSLAKAYIESGIYRNILLVASEKMSSFIDYKDRNTCVIFGDGAASAVISSEGKGLSIDAINVGADGSLGHLIIIPSGGSRLPATDKTIEEKGHFIKMEGKEVFKHAVRRMGSAIEECLKTAGLKESDINWLIPHQANSRIIDAIGKACKIDASKVYMTLHKYGNTSGSSVGIALNELTQAHEIQNNDHLLLAAFGAGLTWGAALLTQGES